MTVLDTLLSGGGEEKVREIAGQLGIDPAQAASAVSTLVPALAGSLKDKAAAGNASEVSDTLNAGRYTDFAEDPSSLSSQEVHEHGNSILNGILGSGNTSGLSTTISERTGISSDVINGMLPVAASILGGFLAKKTQSGTSLEEAAGHAADTGDLAGILKSLTSKLF